jgi:hypothetical protein
MNRPFWLIYPPKKYYAFRRQTLVNWIDRHTHLCWQDLSEDKCSYCNRTGDELWWWLPTCRAHNWHIQNMYHQVPPTAKTNNPYRKKD